MRRDELGWDPEEANLWNKHFAELREAERKTATDKGEAAATDGTDGD